VNSPVLTRSSGEPEVTRFGGVDPAINGHVAKQRIEGLTMPASFEYGQVSVGTVVISARFGIEPPAQLAG
jgi:hypothetical protein